MARHSPSDPRPSTKGPTGVDWQAMAEGAADVLVATGPDGRISWASGAVRETLGWEPADLEGRPSDELVHADDLPRLGMERERCDALGRADIMLRLRAANGTYRWLSFVLRPAIADGRQVGRVGSGRDVDDDVRMREALIESEAGGRLIEANATDVVFRLDPGGLLDWVSPSVGRLMSWRADDLRGMPLVSLVHPGDRAHLAGAVDAVAPDGATRVSARMRMATGRYEQVVLTLRPQAAGYGGAGWRTGSWRPVGDQVEQYEAVRHVFDLLQDGAVVVFDRDLRLRVARGQLLDDGPAAHHRYEGRLALEALGAEAGEHFLPLMRRALAGESVDGEYDDPITQRRLLVRISPLEGDSDGVPGGIISLIDITSRAQLEEQLRVRNAQLEHANRARDAMVATASHELRTPVAVVSSLLEFLRDEPGLTSATRSLVKGGCESADRLARLVEDLMLLARTGGTGLDLRVAPVDPLQLLGHALDEIAVSADEADVRVRVSAIPVDGARGDGHAITRVMLNLVGNAIKFTPAGGVVGVGVRPVDDGWEMRVDDTGIGVPHGEIGALCDPFVRATNATETAIDGAGLGLAIAQGIVQAHGGVMTLDSAQGRGMHARVYWPTAPTGEPVP